MGAFLNKKSFHLWVKINMKLLIPLRPFKSPLCAIIQAPAHIPVMLTALGCTYHILFHIYYNIIERT